MTSSLMREPRSREQVAAATDVIRGVLGDAALAACVYGSAAAGALRAHSDLDVLVVSGRSLTAEERLLIVRRLLTISGRHAVDGEGRPIELTILARPAIVPWRYPPVLELQYGDWLRPAFERGELPAWPRADPDVAILIETARCAALPLLGPPIAMLLEPVPRVDLVRAMMDSIPVLMPGIEEGTDIRNGLLTLARIWATLATGEIRSKEEAADFALGLLPEPQRAALEHARAVYMGDASEDWDPLIPTLRPYVDHVLERIRVLAAEIAPDAGKAASAYG